MTYQDACSWLFSRSRSFLPRNPKRTAALLQHLAQPQLAFSAIHVVGTNGKGSVCAMLSAGLQAAGLRVGRFTSPHLLDFSERIAIDDVPISTNRVIDFVKWAQQQTLDAAFFELTTALAFSYFAEQKIDIAVVEAGVGAAGDATLNVENVRAVVITNIALDHEATIGPSLIKIAKEKAAAIRKNVPIVTAAQGVGREIIEQVAKQKSAPLYVWPENPIFDLPQKPRLQGMHQIENAALACATLRLLDHEKYVTEALQAFWPGRMETIHFDNKTIILDGAHNPAAATMLAKSLPSGFSLIFAAMKRKDVLSILNPLKEKANELIFLSIGEKSANANQLAKENNGLFAENVKEAIIKASEKTIVIAGSLYLVAEVKKFLQNSKKQQNQTD